MKQLEDSGLATCVHIQIILHFAMDRMWLHNLFTKVVKAQCSSQSTS